MPLGPEQLSETLHAGNHGTKLPIALGPKQFREPRIGTMGVWTQGLTAIRRDLLESLSPAAELAKGQSLTHHHRTFHIQGDMPALARLAKITLGVDLEKVRQEMLSK